METTTKKLAIVGGGAAGLMAAIAASDRARELGASLEIAIYERDDRVGRSILATGNGRCNFSNIDLKLYEYHNDAFVRKALDAIGDERFVWDLFEDLGLEWRAESDGRLYPKTNKASSVVDVLRAATAHARVHEVVDTDIVSIEPPRSEGGCFTLRTKEGVFHRADAVIVACGGRAISSLEAAGLAMIPTSPMLGPLRVTDECIPFVRELDNIRVKCTALLFRQESENVYGCIGSQIGEIIFRKYGVSGICVFDLSRKARPGDYLDICFLDDLFINDGEDFLRSRRKMLAKRYGDELTYGQMLRGLLLPRVSEAILKVMGAKPEDPCGGDDLEALASYLTRFPLEIAGIGDVDLCQVRRGGVPVEAVSPQTMQALEIPGLFVTGEALDVDGPCGGYNLHWAWSSGHLAGKSAAETLLGDIG